jgi:hypothetical protein
LAIELHKAYIINQVIPSIESKYDLYVDYLCVSLESVQIRYRIFPALLYLERSSSISWCGFGIDNFGNTYDFVSGDSAISSDKTHLKGIILFNPIINKNTEWLEITITSRGIYPTVRSKIRILFSADG